MNTKSSGVEKRILSLRLIVVKMRAFTEFWSLDKGFDYPEVREVLEARQYVEHIRCRGEEIQAKRDIPGYRARRWVVERSHSWMNRFRRILIRWEKKTANYQAMLELACAFICFRTAGVFG